MANYTLHYSNGFTYKPKYDEYPEEYWVSTLHLNQKCKITNYDPATSDGKKKGYITIDIGNNGTIIKDGEGDKLSENKVIADFSQKKFSIFHDIAALDDNGDKDKLTMEDLENLDESYKSSWGLKDLIVDLKKGVATLVWGVGDILRIDFETEEEKLNKQEQKSNVQVNNKSQVKNEYSQSALKDQKEIDIKTAQSKTPSALQEASKVKYCNDSEDSNILLDFAYEKYIPKEYDKYIKKAAKEAGVSENLIKFLIFTEGKNSGGTFKAALKTYKCSAGKLTIGFGHTNATKTFLIDEYTEISLQEAFDILVKDIKHHRTNVINTIGVENFNKLNETNRESLAEALIDWSFNAGTRRLKESENVRDNLKSNSYFGLATTSLWNEGDARRSIYRMLYAVQYMKEEDKETITKRFLNSQMRGKKDQTYLESIKLGLSGYEKLAILGVINKHLM